MKKIIKILFVVFIILIVYTYISNIYATGLNMNLSDNDSTTYGSATANTAGTSTQNSSTSVSNPSESALDSLTVSDMINIVLCAIGVILILLGIAIIIRQKTV